MKNKQTGLKVLRNLCCALALTLLTAKANTVYTLNTPNADLGPYPGPYGTVTVTYGDATHATIEFVVNPGFFFVDGAAVDWNLNGTATVSVNSKTPSSVNLTSDGAGNADGWGNFNTRYTSGNAGPSGRFTEALFDLTATGTTSWTSSDDVLSLNNLGNVVAAHLGVIDPLTGNALAQTGFATAGRSVPDGGATLALLGVGLLSLGAVRRKL